jgi:carbamoylphosphate synthase small subunit
MATATILTVDGQCFKGKYFRNDCGKSIIGELVFQTGNCGYVEVVMF